MKTNLPIFPVADLNSVRFAELSNVYNGYAHELGIKEIKKFRDKPTGIKRVTEIMAQYQEAVAKVEQTETPAPVKPVKAAKPAKKSTGKGKGKGNTKTDMTTKVEIAKGRENKEASIADAVFTAVIEFGNPTVQELVDHIVETYTKPRSDVPVTRGFVVSAIRFFVKEGTLKFS